MKKFSNMCFMAVLPILAISASQALAGGGDISKVVSCGVAVSLKQKSARPEMAKYVEQKLVAVLRAKMNQEEKTIRRIGIEAATKCGALATRVWYGLDPSPEMRSKAGSLALYQHWQPAPETEFDRAQATIEQCLHKQLVAPFGTAGIAGTDEAQTAMAACMGK